MSKADKFPANAGGNASKDNQETYGRIDFIGYRYIFFLISAALILAGLVSIFVIHDGFRLGVEFSGGLSMDVEFPNGDVGISEIREALGKIGYGTAVIQQKMDEEKANVFLIRINPEEGKDYKVLADDVKKILDESFPPVDGKKTYVPIDETFISGKVKNDFVYNSFWTVIASCICMAFYIAFRFETTYAIAAIIALIHDVFITLGFISLFDKEISLLIIAALLTILGYSINDTIVVFDRIRENLRLRPDLGFASVANLSINQTLARTILTSATFVMVAVILFIFGGDILHDFAFALLVGAIIGTYSSIYVASPIVIEWKKIRAEAAKKNKNKNKNKK